jgi:hypothetical protein
MKGTLVAVILSQRLEQITELHKRVRKKLALQPLHGMVADLVDGAMARLGYSTTVDGWYLDVAWREPQ